MADCQHESFKANVCVNRLEDTGCFTADVRVECADCGTQFRFLGLPPGLLLKSPSVSVDGTEARMPIEPGGSIEKTMCGGKGMRFEVPEKGPVQ